MKGYVFDFKRFSTHDGHGIRTTIFLKGCTLKCVWCQNPEGISIKQRPLYFTNKCIHCNTCVHEAKHGGVYLRDGKIKLDVSKPENWKEIIHSCPSGALAMDSKEMKYPPFGVVHVPTPAPPISFSRVFSTASNFGRRISACFLMCSCIPSISLKKRTCLNWFILS